MLEKTRTLLEEHRKLQEELCKLQHEKALRVTLQEGTLALNRHVDNSATGSARYLSECNACRAM